MFTINFSIILPSMVTVIWRLRSERKESSISDNKEHWIPSPTPALASSCAPGARPTQSNPHLASRGLNLWIPVKEYTPSPHQHLPTFRTTPVHLHLIDVAHKTDTSRLWHQMLWCTWCHASGRFPGPIRDSTDWGMLLTVRPKIASLGAGIGSANTFETSAFLASTALVDTAMKRLAPTTQS